MTEANKTITRYIKDRRGKKRGVLVGVQYPLFPMPSVQCPPMPFSDPGYGLLQQVVIGWSLCRKDEPFDKEEASNIAASHVGQPVPPSIFPDAQDFRLQCFRHFDEAFHIRKVTAMPVKPIPRTRQARPVCNSGHRPECPLHGAKGPIAQCLCKAIAQDPKV